MTTSQHTQQLADEPDILTVVWTKAAVARWDATGTFDPRHTISAYPVNLSSPWFPYDMARKFGKSWRVVDGANDLVARS